MKKRITALFLALMFSVMGIITSNLKADAEEIGQDAELSEIMTEDALIGYAELKTRGAYLASGYSIINDAGSGKIGWGGVTSAAVKCKVSTLAIVERKVDGSWVRVTSASATKTSAYTAVVSKTLSVASGYYYRVRCVHYASTDTSSSYTSGLWM